MSENTDDTPDEPAAAPATERGNRNLNIVGVIVFLGLLCWILLPAIQSVRHAHGPRCINNLKNISLALQTYHDIYREYPPAYTVDGNGKPLHSWRTLLLPYLEEEDLYKSINLSKPWDDPVNAKALNAPLLFYHCPDAEFPANYTNYLAIVSNDSCLRPKKSLRLPEISDGTENTVIVMEMCSEQAVPWMSPQDASEEMVLGLGQDTKLSHGEYTHALFAIGSVKTKYTFWPLDKRRAVLTATGDEVTGDLD